MLGGALEARRGRGEHTAEKCRLEDLDRWMAPSQSIHKYRFEPTDMPSVGSAVCSKREP